MTPLQLATLEDLMGELERRFDNFIFAWSTKRTDAENGYGSWKRGDTCACIGLCRCLERRMHEMMTEPVDFDEDDEEDDEED